MHQNSSLRKSLNHKTGIVVLCFVVCAVLSMLLYTHFFLRIKNIYVIGFPKHMTLYGLDKAKQSILFLLQTNVLSEELVSLNPIIHKAEIEKIYPDTIHIKIEIDGPIASFETQKGFFLLSSRGRIIQKDKDQKEFISYPLIRYYQNLSYNSFQAGDILDNSDIKKTLYILKRVQDMGLKVITIDIDGIDMIGLNLKGKQILFSVEKDIESQLYELKQITRQFRIQGSNYRKLDLRFNKPVLEISTK